MVHLHIIVDEALKYHLHKILQINTIKHLTLLSMFHHTSLALLQQFSSQLGLVPNKPFRSSRGSQKECFHPENSRNICINLKIPYSYSNPTGGQHHHCNIQYPVDDVNNTDTHNTWRDQQSWWMMNNFYRVQVLRVIMDQAYQNNSN